ncbi:MAG: FAD-dependent oxidoreductase [Pseudomonadota bacterium]
MKLQNPQASQPGSESPDDVIVLGAGVAGLAAADQLIKAGVKATILDSSTKCGGFHQDQKLGPYSFDLGSIFYEPESRIFNLSPEIRELCPIVQRHTRRLDSGNKVLRYPFEPSELRQWSHGAKAAAIRDLALGRLLHRRDGTLDAICRRRLGTQIYTQSGLRDYIERFNLLDPKDVDEAFFFHRMGQVERTTRPSVMLSRALRALNPKRPAPRKWPGLHVRPAEGYDVIFEAIQRHLGQAGLQFRLNETVKTIQRTSTGYQLTTDKGQLNANVVVNAAPIDAVHHAVFGTHVSLEALGLLSMFVSSATLDERTGNVFYNFSQTGAWKRATIYSRIYPEQGDGRAFYTVERCITAGTEPDVEAEFNDFAKQIEAANLATDLRLEGLTLTPDVYPVYRAGETQKVGEAIDRLAKIGIISVGRQGRFEYLPTSSLVIKRVLEELAMQT